MEGLTKAGPARIKTIINCSHSYGDGMHVELQNRLDVESLLTIWCHKNCVCSYVSPQRLNRHLKRQGNETNNKFAVPKRQRHSDISFVRFLEHCLFCGLQCSKYVHAYSSYTTQDELDNAFCELIAVVSENLPCIWNSVELFQLYQSKACLPIQVTCGLERVKYN